MALKFKFAAKAEIPAEHLSLYTERDGAHGHHGRGVSKKNPGQDWQGLGDDSGGDFGLLSLLGLLGQDAAFLIQHLVDDSRPRREPP